MATESPYQQTANEVILRNRRFAKAALWNLGFFSFFMMLGPVVAYFAVKNYYEAEMNGYFGDTKPEHVGAGAAVITVHVVLAAFIYVAWNEDSDEGDAALKGWVHPEIQKKLDELDRVHKEQFEQEIQGKKAGKGIVEPESTDEKEESTPGAEGSASAHDDNKKTQ